MSETGRTVETYVAGLDDWRRTTVAHLVELVRAVAPEARASIKWAQPVFESNGPAVWIKAHANNVNIGFWRGAELEDRHGLLVGKGDVMRHVTLRSGDAVPDDAIRDYVRQAMDLNAAKGDPTRRR